MTIMLPIQRRRQVAPRKTFYGGGLDIWVVLDAATIRGNPHDTVVISNGAVEVTHLPSHTGNDIVVITSSVSRTAGHPRSLSDSVAISDSASRATQKTRTISDAVIVSSSAARILNTPRTSSEIIAVNDVPTKTNVNPRTSSDSITTVFDNATIPVPYVSQLGLQPSQVGYIYQVGGA